MLKYFEIILIIQYMLSKELSTLYELICINLFYVIKWIILVGFCTEKKIVQLIDILQYVPYASIKTLEITFLFYFNIYAVYFKSNLFLKYDRFMYNSKKHIRVQVNTYIASM